MLALVLVNGVDLPRHDQWSLLRDIVDAREGRFSWSQLVRYHNEHRLVVPRAIVIGLAQLTDWNTRVEMGATVLVAGLVLLALGILWRGRSPGALALAGLFWLSLHAWGNWLWGFQLCLVSGVGAAMTALVALAQPGLRKTHVAVAIACALVASFSFLMGLLAWPIGALLLAFRAELEPRRRWGLAGAWLAVGLVALALYTWGVAPVIQRRLGAGGRSFAPGVILQGASALLGAGLWGPQGHEGVSTALGFLLQGSFVGLAVRLLRRGRRDPAVLGALALGLLGIATAYVVAVGRGGYLVTASRYTTLAAPAWIGTLLAFDSARRPGWVGRLGLGVLALGLLARQPRSFEQLRERSLRQAAAQAAVLSGRGLTWERVGVFYVPRSWLERLASDLDLLKAHRLSLFRDAPDAERRLSSEVPPRSFQVRIAGAARTPQGWRVRLVLLGGPPENGFWIDAAGTDVPARRVRGAFSATGEAEVEIPVGGAVELTVSAIDPFGRWLRHPPLAWSPP